MKRKPANFFDLVREFPLRPIRNKQHHARAIKVLLKLAAKGEEAFTRDETDYFETLAQLVERYEKTYVADTLTPLDGIDLLKFLMAERGMTVSGLGKVIGSQSAASLVLSGKRELSKAMIAAISSYFNLSAAAFLPNHRKAS